METKSHKSVIRTIVGLVLLTAIVIVAGVTVTACGSGTSTTTDTPVAAHTTSATTTDPTPTPSTSLDPRFVQQDVGLGDLNRVIGTGLPGNTAPEFTASVLKVSGHSAQALAIYASAVHLWPDPNNTTGLLEPDGKYLSPQGMMLWASLQGALKAKGTSSKVGQAPANSYNTGVSGGRFGCSAVAGISGNRTALVVTFKDGTKFVALRRCGNLALPGPGRLPVVPTDNLKPKIASQDPGPRGNAKVGSGQNATKGPGDKTPKPPKPGKTPRPNPATPSPTPSASSTGIPGGSTADPAPTPTPEISAPTPTNPASATPVPIPTHTSGT